MTCGGGGRLLYSVNAATLPDKSVTKLPFPEGRKGLVSMSHEIQLKNTCVLHSSFGYWVTNALRLYHYGENGIVVGWNSYLGMVRFKIEERWQDPWPTENVEVLRRQHLPFAKMWSNCTSSAVRRILCPTKISVLVEKKKHSDERDVLYTLPQQDVFHL